VHRYLYEIIFEERVENISFNITLKTLERGRFSGFTQSKIGVFINKVTTG